MYVPRVGGEHGKPCCSGSGRSNGQTPRNFTNNNSNIGNGRSETVWGGLGAVWGHGPSNNQPADLATSQAGRVENFGELSRKFCLPGCTERAVVVSSLVLLNVVFFSAVCEYFWLVVVCVRSGGQCIAC